MAKAAQGLWQLCLLWGYGLIPACVHVSRYYTVIFVHYLMDTYKAQLDGIFETKICVLERITILLLDTDFSDEYYTWFRKGIWVIRQTLTMIASYKKLSGQLFPV